MGDERASPPGTRPSRSGRAVRNPRPSEEEEMRPLGMLVVALLLVGGQVRAQQPAGPAPLAEAGDPSIAAVPESSGFLRPRPSLGSRLASWRPISRWLGRTSAPPGQESVAIPVSEGPRQPAGSVAGS